MATPKDLYPVELGTSGQAQPAPPQKPSQKSVFWYYFKSNEDLLGIVYAKKDHAYTRLRRIIVLLCTIGITFASTYDIDNRKAACKRGTTDQRYSCMDLTFDLVGVPIMVWLMTKGGKFFMVLYSIDVPGGTTLKGHRICRFMAGGILICLTIGVLAGTTTYKRVLPWSLLVWRTLVIQVESLVINVLWISFSWWVFPAVTWLSFIGTRARHMAADDPFEAIEKDLRRPVPIGNGGQGNSQNLNNPVALPQGDPARPPFVPQPTPAMPYRYGPQYNHAFNPYAFPQGYPTRPPFPPVPAPAMPYYGPPYGYAVYPNT